MPEPSDARGVRPVFGGLLLTVFMATLLSAALLGDLIGHKGLFLAAIAIFVTGSAIGGFAGSVTILVLGRFVQGLGGGGLVITAQAIIADVLPPRQRAAYTGVLGSVFALTSVGGPLVGGWFTDVAGWRWCFWTNIPLGLASMGVAALVLRLPAGPRRRPRLDVSGMAWCAVAVTALVVIPLGLFRDRTVLLATAAGLLMSVGLFAVSSYLPTFLQVLGLAVQNAVAHEIVGTATAAHNFFREIGASLGTAAAGSVFTARLAVAIAGSAAAGVGTAGLTPGAAARLPDRVRTALADAYASALTPVLGWLVLLFVVGLVIAAFLPDLPLRSTTTTVSSRS